MEAEMRTLRIVDFDGDHLGTITQDTNGELHLEVVDEGYREDMSDFLQRITSQPIYLKTGERIEREGKITFVTRRKEVTPTDPDFLAGVKGLLNKSRFGETRVRGLLLREGGEHGC